MKTTEDYLVTAINNLLKTQAYLQLTLQRKEKLISKKKFKKELKNADFILKVDPQFDDFDFVAIEDIIKKLERQDLTHDEISAMFSIPMGNAFNFVKWHNEPKEKPEVSVKDLVETKDNGTDTEQEVNRIIKEFEKLIELLKQVNQ
jgi:hypothetical protein